MAACERCWREAGGDSEEYAELVKRRDCTPEQQAGIGADHCPFCKRSTIHVMTDVCLVCERQF